MIPSHKISDTVSLEQVLSTIPSGLFVVDNEMKVVYWNPEAERITGYTSEEALGQPCSFLQGIPCGERCGLFSKDIQKPIIGAKCTVVTKAGDTIHLLKNIDYLRNDNGEIIGGIESFIDITRQKSVEDSLRDLAANLESRAEDRARELKESEIRFRSVLDTMDDLAYIATEDFKLTFMNRTMQDLFGNRTGEKCYDVLHDQPQICPWCPMEKVLHNRTMRDERKLGKSERIYEIIHSPLHHEDGLKQKLAVCRDITERKNAEAELREANQELDAFAHSISHDLRGILAPVVTYMDFIRMTYAEALDDQVMQILEEVERQSERAIALLDDLLDLAQVSHIRPGEYLTDVNMIIDEITSESKYGDKQTDHLDVATLPPTWLPETLVYQLFSNLISNARQYAPSENGPIEIGSWTDEGDTIYFVRDHGPGVAASETEDIFNIFYRGKTSRAIRGTGVGLAIVRKIALRCNGRAWVEQTPGGGATFCISLPQKPAIT